MIFTSSLKFILLRIHDFHFQINTRKQSIKWALVNLSREEELIRLVCWLDYYF